MKDIKIRCLRFLFWRHSDIVTKSPKFENPLRPCSHLFNFILPLLPSNVQNLISTPLLTTTTFTATSYKTINFMILKFSVISPSKYHKKKKKKKNDSWMFPKHTRIQMVLIMRDGLQISLIILAKFKQIDDWNKFKSRGNKWNIKQIFCWKLRTLMLLQISE